MERTFQWRWDCFACCESDCWLILKISTIKSLLVSHAACPLFLRLLQLNKCNFHVNLTTLAREGGCKLNFKPFHCYSLFAESRMFPINLHVPSLAVCLSRLRGGSYAAKWMWAWENCKTSQELCAIQTRQVLIGWNPMSGMWLDGKCWITPSSRYMRRANNWHHSTWNVRFITIFTIRVLLPSWRFSFYELAEMNARILNSLSGSHIFHFAG